MGRGRGKTDNDKVGEIIAVWYFWQDFWQDFSLPNLSWAYPNFWKIVKQCEEVGGNNSLADKHVQNFSFILQMPLKIGSEKAA